jgi:diguanylate cyclase (GGDEF)-like protein/PAS domain S-box-containing protein
VAQSVRYWNLSLCTYGSLAASAPRPEYVKKELLHRSDEPVTSHANGTRLGVDVTAKDWADSVPAQAGAENSWKLALEGSGAGAWDWDLQTGVQTHSNRWLDMLGFAPGEIGQSNQEFVSRVHPEDLPKVQAAFVAQMHERTDTYTADFRLRCKDGSWKWIQTRGMVVRRDAQQKALRMIGTHTDITERKHAENELRIINTRVNENAQLLEITLTNISQGIVVFDANQRVQKFNPRLCELLEIPEAYMATLPTAQEMAKFQIVQSARRQNLHKIDPVTLAYFKTMAEGSPATVPDSYLRTTPSGRTLEVKSQRLASGGLVRTFADVTFYIQSEANSQRLDSLLAATQAIARVGAAEIDYVNKTLFWTEGVYRIFETTPEDYKPTMGSSNQFLTPSALEQLKSLNSEVAEHPMSHDMELDMITAKGRSICVHSITTSVWDQGQLVKRTAVLQDITERKKSESLIRQQAYFDALTGLPNRRMLRERLEQEIKKTKRDSQQLAILFIDLDHFKEVNDTLGHNSGDQLLIEAARRIKGCLRESDTVARMGGDEFTVILSELSEANSMGLILQELLRALGAVFQLGAEQVFVSASIGVTIYPLDATEVEDLFKNADQALYVAKGAGRNRFSFFTPALQEAAQTRVRLANDLRIGLSDKQFRVVYQPIIELATRAVHKAEVLIRWQHPTRGLVSPAAFIPIAEASGLIVEIGEWVFQQAVAQVVDWRNRFDPDFQISINKSPVQFHQTANNALPWSKQLLALGLPGNSIVVEITEGLLLDTGAGVAEHLLELGDAGIQVSLDDFGTGYSSMSYLQKFDIDFIKIDQSFVRHLIPSSTDLALCKAIIVMAHELGMKVIAEGVETELQRDLLLAAGCDYGQGYLFAKPMPVADFEAFVEARQLK